MKKFLSICRSLIIATLLFLEGGCVKTFALILALLFSVTGFGQTITTNTNWSTISPVPVAGTNIIVTNGATLTVDVSDAICSNVSLGADEGSAGPGTLKFNAGSILNLSGGTNGTLTLGLSASHLGTIDMTDGGTVSLKSFLGSNGALIPGSGTIEVTTTTTLHEDITTYNNLRVNVSAGTVTLFGATTFNGNLTISAGTLSANNFDLAVKGNWTNNSATSAFIAGTASTTFSGTGAQSIDGSFGTSFNNLIIAGTANTITSGINSTVVGNLTVSSGTLDLGSFTANRSTSGGTLTVSNGATLKVGGTNTIPSNYTTHSIGSTSTLEYGGSNQSLIVLNSAQDYGHLTISGSGTKTLASSVNVGGTLTLTSSTITTGANTISIKSDGSVSRTSGHVFGNFQKNISIGAASKTFEIGDVSNYTPVTIAFAIITTAGNLTASTAAGDHASLSSSTINGSKSVNRTWSLINSGIVFTTYGATFTFVAGDLDGGTTTSNVIVGRYNAGWTYPTVGSKTSTSTEATGVTAFGDFQVGENCSPPTTSTAGPDQTGSDTCGLTTVTLAANTPTVGTGAWSIVSGAGGTVTTPTSATSTFSGIAGTTYTLRWTISNGSCTASTDDVVITFNQAPFIISQPSSATICSGQLQTFSVTASGADLTYQWRKGGINIPGANSPTYNIASVTTGNAGNYDVIVSGTCTPSITSSSASLVVQICLESVSDFTLFTLSGAVGNTGTSTITGNIGSNLGAITGFGPPTTVNGTIYNADGVTSQASTDLMNAYDQLNFANVTATHAALLGNGETVGAGVYDMTGAGSMTGDLYLDAQSDPNALFIFRIGGAFDTGPSSTVHLVGGASSCNVFWIAQGAIAMGASTKMKGTLIAHNAAISMAASGILEGRMLSTTGAVAVDQVLAYIPKGSATIAYAKSIYRTDEGSASVIQTGTTGGEYSSTVGLTIDRLTGEISFSTSTIGTYQVIYTIGYAGGCGTFQTTTSVTIKEACGTDFTWLGLSSNWYDPSNWCVFQVPSLSGTLETIHIPNTANHPKIDGSAVVISGTLFLEGNAQLTVKEGHSLTLSGTSDVQAAQGSLIVLEKGAIYRNLGAGVPIIQIHQVLAGFKGWRMLGSPVTTTYKDLLTNMVSQGFTGATYANLQPNILHWDETHKGTSLQGWRKPADLNNFVIPGKGFYAYVFNGAPLSVGSTNYNDTLPISLSATGAEVNVYTAGHNFQVSFTPRDTSLLALNDTSLVEVNRADEGFNLIANPTVSTLDFFAQNSWTKTNIDEVIYIWDPNYNAGQGAFRTFNGSTGDLNTGLLSPYQGFWIRTNASSPSLILLNNAKSAVNTNYVGRMVSNAPLNIELQLSSNGLKAATYISFSENGKESADPFDAYQLESLAEDWLLLYSYGSLRTKSPLVINHLPALNDQERSIPLHVTSSKGGAAATAKYILQWELPSEWPSEVSIVLMDHIRELAIDMTQQTQYDFNFKAPKVLDQSKSRLDNGLRLPQAVVFQSPYESGEANMRVNKTSPKRPFTILVGGEYKGGIVEYRPDVSKLFVPYPNPFQSKVHISFFLPIEGEAEIRITDMQGRELAHFPSKKYSTGTHELVWEAPTISVGMYIIHLLSDGKLFSQKLIKN